jgi:hypothetical protein
MSRDAADLAREAARQIEQRGLSKNSLEGEDGSVCMYGALNVAQCGNTKWVTEISSDHKEVLAALRNHFPEDVLQPFPGAASFNDLPDTTATDVAKVLLKVADELELA